MEPFTLAVIVGVVVYCGLIALIPRNILAEPNRYTKSMLEQLEKETSGQNMPSTDTVSIMREHLQDASILTRVFFTFPGVKLAYPYMLKAGLRNSMDKFFGFCLVLLLLMVFFLKGGGVWGLLASVAIVYFVGWRFVKGRIRKRNEAFLNAFPDALDMIVRSVRSGYPLNAAIRMVSENMQAPVSTEFKQVADETAYGSSLMEALTRLSFRIDEPDIRFFVVVLAVQQEVGGNLAEVLSNLSGIIRKRKHLRLKIKALTSEGRATAWVLGLLPVVVFLMIHIVAPKHLDPFFTSLLGNIVLGFAIGIVLVGALIVKKMINIKV